MATAHAHHHGHGHGHDHHGHGHGHEHHGSERRVFWAAILTAGFMLAEVAGGLLAGSLALVADAAHLLTDAGSPGLGWFAFRIARQPADWRRTYGFDRFQILAAFTNGGVLFLAPPWMVPEAAGRLVTPEPVLGGAMLAIAALGLLANAGVFAILHGGDRENLNVRGAILHVLGDVLGSVAAILAAGIILATGWTPADPILSVLVSLLVLRAAGRMGAGAGHILLEGAPADLDVRTIGPDLVENVPGVADVHHVHAWSLTEKKPLVTLHARVEEPHGSQATLTAIKARLRERFGIGHATVEMEQDGCADGRHDC